MMDVRSALDAIAADAARGDIVFPTHTEIALRVQRMLDDPDCAIDALGKLVCAEPILVTRVLAIANSVAYNPGGRAITELKSAIARLGFATLRALAAAVIVRQMKEMSKVEEHRALAAKLWEHTASVASLARVIARRVTRQNPDAAFFAGIVHEVGSFYLIARASTFPGLLTRDLELWHGEGEASVGRAVLQALEVPTHILDAMETLWSGFLAMPPSSLGDTLLLANQLSPIESPIDALAGMSRKGMDVELDVLIDDETLTSILAESAAEVASLSAALKG
ncbi:HDOD domain-containing protein [Propionivibrio sp.]|uniref:HDOD domain-containing protein n=1 Tax=Propionivibrio sp. TaxID=2212460 RepID=UPI00261E698B|nr:HDOD domain-containing protein [Propionivibrio sp.]